MALYGKESVTWASETLPPISETKFIAAEHQFASTESITPNSNTMVSSSVDTVRDTKSTSATYSLPTLAPLTNQDMEVRVLAVGGLPQPSLHMNPLCGQQREQDRRVRREIANSNERRRMQSINAGFKSLKAILPATAGDKLSKAAILQQTAEFIFQLEDDKRKLRFALSECKCSAKHRSLLCDGHEKDEGIGSPREEDLEEIRRDTMEIHRQLDKERRLRMLLEEKVRELESQNKVREIARTVMDQQRHIIMSASASGDPSHRINIKKEGDLAPESFETATPTVKQPHSTKSEFPSTNLQPDLPPLTQPVINSLPAAEMYVPEMTDSVPPAALCITVPQPADSKTSDSTKASGSVPKSSQPLKKRAFPDTDRSSPSCKVPKTQTSSVPCTMVNPPLTSPILLSSLSSQPKEVFVQNNSALPIQEGKLVSYSTSTLTTAQPVVVPEHPVFLSAPQSVAPTFISLQPPVLAPSSSSWPETQAAAAPSALPVASTHPANSHYVLQPALPRIAPNSEELTLNQLNSLPLSMTLTQLNALPTMTRIDTVSGSAVLPGHRPQQPQFLPIVAMDTVLSRHVERRVSSTTTDSAGSSEDGRIEMTEEPVRSEDLKTPASKPFRSRSDPLPQKETAECQISSPDVKCPTALSVASDGPGSPTVIRHIDRVASRRNLEAIVKAIDHLEQQERRNSQDQQIKHEPCL